MKILNNRKAIFMVGGTVLLLLGAGGYTWWSVAYWNSYNTRQQTLQQTTTRHVDTTIKLKAETKEQRVEKINALKGIVSELSAYDSLCDINGSVSWQQIFGDVKQREAACKETQTQFLAFRHQLDLIVRYLEEEHQLSEVLAAAPDGGEVAEGDFEKKLKGWKTIKTALNDVKDDAELASVKQKTQESVDSIINAWQDVITSHKAKDKQKYLQAVKSLATAHDTLNSIVKADEEKLYALTSALSDVAIKTNLIKE
jgi:hypothetical protein